jgi:Uma2 family endonuclease
MSALPKKKLTEAEYLAIEWEAECKSEFLNGEMFPMAGASWQHNKLTANLLGELYQRLKGGPCDVYAADMRVKVTRTGLYTYPDLLIVCGPPEFDPMDANTLVNPQVIYEILSKSTEGYVRGAKFRHYQRLPSLQEFVLVSQDQMLLERFVRQSDGRWLLTNFDDPAGEFALASIPVRVPIADIYRGVELPNEPEH